MPESATEISPAYSTDHTALPDLQQEAASAIGQRTPAQRRMPVDVFSKQLCEAISKLTGLNTLRLERNAKLPGKTTTSDGRPFQHLVDIFWEFELDGRTYRAVIETRAWPRIVDLGTVLQLKAVMDDLTHSARAVILTIGGFQRDAFVFAKAHGIAPCILRPISNSGGEVGREVFLTVRAYVPKFEELLLKLDQEWTRTQPGLCEGGALRVLSSPEYGTLLYSEGGRPVATLQQILSAMLPQQAKAISKLPVRKTFARPTFLHTEEPEPARLKLCGIEAIVSTSETSSRYAATDTLVNLLTGITSSKSYRLTDDLCISKVASVGTCDSASSDAPTVWRAI